MDIIFVFLTLALTFGLFGLIAVVSRLGRN